MLIKIQTRLLHEQMTTAIKLSEVLRKKAGCNQPFQVKFLVMTQMLLTILSSLNE